MLECYVIDSPDQKTDLFQDWIKGESRWIVNDLDSKIWLKNWLLVQKDATIHSDRVLRASELWQSFVFTQDPHWRTTPSGFSQFLIEKWMVEILQQDQSLRINSLDSQKLYSTMGQILPILSHFSGDEMIGQWFAEKEDARERWQDWYELSKRIWQKFIDLKILPEEWLKALLMDSVETRATDGIYIFDLGLDLDDIESELILNLSRMNEVRVIVPKNAEDVESYRNLLDRCQPKFLSSPDAAASVQYTKLPTMLSEVKHSVALVRSWLDQGASPDSIAIVSPQIENYWPTLSEYLDIEGIPCQKNRATPLSQIPFYQKWLSQMRLSLSQLQKGDGEYLVFSDSENVSVDFETFRYFFTEVYDVEDYERLPDIQNLWPSKQSPESLINLSQFMTWAAQWVKPQQWNELLDLWQNLDSVASLEETLTYEQWLSFFENYFARNEKTLEVGDPSGLKVLSTDGAQNQILDRVIVLGLSEKNLKENLDTPLQWGDVESIKMLFGFNLPHRDRELGIGKLQWLRQKNCREFYYTYSESDFSGQFQAPSILWLKGALDENSDLPMQSPQFTRWDLLSQQLAQGGSNSILEQKLAQDMGVQKIGTSDFGEASISASSIEEYFKCPFKFYARKILGLAVKPHLDLDIDVMSRGRILHRICELIVQEKLWERPSCDLAEIVEKARLDVEVDAYSDEAWEFLRTFYKKLAESFLAFEKQWRQDYPETQSFALEKSLKTKVRYSNGELIFSESEGRLLRGTIDRIDQDTEGRKLIIDYKSSSGDLRQHGSWLKYGKIQMLLYSLALRGGVVTGKQESVAGAYYQVLKEMERSKGFHRSDLSESFLPKDRQAIAEEKIETLFSEAENLIGEVLENMDSGVYEPNPSDEKHCDSCDWNQICRYPNLNQ